MTDREQSAGNPVLVIGPGEPGAAPSLTFHISPGYGAELTERLVSQGITYSPIIELSAASELVPYLVYLGGTTGVLSGLAKVITAICRRDDGKQFKIVTDDGKEYSGRGLSVDDALRLLQAARADNSDDDLQG